MYRKGYSVIEVLLSGSILALAITGIVSAILIAQRNSQASIAQSQALEMAKEGIDALRSIRDRDYSLLNDTTTLSGDALSFSEDGQWSIITSPTVDTDRLSNPTRIRRIKIENGPVSNSKKVTVTVEYQVNPEGDLSKVELTETLINISKKIPSGVTAESSNYRLIDDNFGGPYNSFTE
ncbi:MAG: hypothetical protein RLZZ223_475, partial [Candidatus Parcubacteria bacterium]|jgi:Tfp pilus assembly protein PilV